MDASFDRSYEGTGVSVQRDDVTVSGPVPARAARADWAASEATRYLCVGAYIGNDFRRRVLREVLSTRYRAVAPSYGIDIVPVIRHCLRARHREIARNLAFIGLLLLIAVWSLPLLIAALFLGWGLNQVVAAIRALLRGKAQAAGVRLGLSVVLLWVALLAISYYAIGSTDPGGYGFGFSALLSALGGSLFLLIVIWALAAGVRFAELLVNHRTVLTELAPGRFDPQAAPTESPRHSERIAYLAQAQTGNVTYYARTSLERPFVGAGTPLDPAALTVPLLRKEPGEAPPARELTVPALYRRMRQAMVTLADPDNPAAERVEGLSMQSRVFVSGLLRPDEGMLDAQTGLPRHYLSRAELDGMVQYDRNRATEYLAIRIGAWEGELEVTVFLYFSIRGSTLYTEFVPTVLPSIRESFHNVDRFSLLDPVTYTRMALISLRDLPTMIIRAPWDLARTAKDHIWGQLNDQFEARDIRSRLAFDYGIGASVREMGADFTSANYFQSADAARYIYLVERRLRDAVGEVLDDFGYVSEEFLEKSQTVIDNSVHISGGTFSANALAVGPNARAQVRPPAAAARPPAAPKPS
ncbi:hypothetical protein [Kineosporia babensis]|uniref:Uncharacterized protein n=1 Tax=Kineosporia babensis TaxID=499548 RepID=A0A9X1SWE5_9ACTN|nr:hypothetical protein [Kineosporia babensis]MCD5314997.1 hypothetical protein [Kineosporia babensis]